MASLVCGAGRGGRTRPSFCHHSRWFRASFVGGPNPFSAPWLGFPQGPSGVDIILDLGAENPPPPLTWLAAHVLLVSPVWFVDGSASSRVYRNITSSLPASVVFRVADVLAPSSAIAAPWRNCGVAVARPWSGECSCLKCWRGTKYCRNVNRTHPRHPQRRLTMTFAPNYTKWEAQAVLSCVAAVSCGPTSTRQWHPQLQTRFQTLGKLTPLKQYLSTKLSLTLMGWAYR